MYIISKVKMYTLCTIYLQTNRNVLEPDFIITGREQFQSFKPREWLAFNLYVHTPHISAELLNQPAQSSGFQFTSRLQHPPTPPNHPPKSL